MCFSIVGIENSIEFSTSKTCLKGYVNYLVTIWSVSVNVRVQRKGC